jgi:hypothetical protein
MGTARWSRVSSQILKGCDTVPAFHAGLTVGVKVKEFAQILVECRLAP